MQGVVFEKKKEKLLSASVDYDDILHENRLNNIQ